MMYDVRGLMYVGSLLFCARLCRFYKAQRLKEHELTRIERMRKVTFKGLDPDDLHTCQHCQHAFHDIGMNRKVCAKSGQPIAPMDYIQVNDCEEYKSPYLSDYRRRTDLERQLNK